MLLKLKDGGVLDFRQENSSWGGCGTCDYGSSYINELEIELTKSILFISVNSMYDYAITDGFLMKLFLSNVEEIQKKTEKEFQSWITEKLNYESDDVRIRVRIKGR